MRPSLDPRDVAPLDTPKALAAAERFRLEVVTRGSSDAFVASYQMLDGFFGPLGELEPASALAEFVESERIEYAPGLEGHYRLIAAWDGDELAGVRDFYVDLDIPGRRCIIALSHAYVAPEYRRTGLAALFRALPASLGRRVVEERIRLPLPIMVSAEMEPVSADKPDTVIRLLAYGRSGFKVIDPARLPYSQPDFRDPSALGSTHTAFPLLAVVRVVDRPDATTIPIEMAAAFSELFHVCHRRYLPPSRVDPSEDHALSTLRRGRRGDDNIALLPLPTGPDALDHLRPLLLAEVIKLYPPGLRGPQAPTQDPEEEWRGLLRAWRHD